MSAVSTLQDRPSKGRTHSSLDWRERSRSSGGACPFLGLRSAYLFNLAKN